MRTEWDYTSLADAYLKRPNYSDAAIEGILKIADAKKGYKVCDVGAGVAHLTLMLAAHGLDVVAVEPNDKMRANGIKRTERLNNIQWFEGTGEQTGQPSQSFNLITFGSSFNVCDRPKALKEVARMLKPHGWFACMWNHRHLDDKIQSVIERIIMDQVPDYGYGTRRQDQTNIIESSNLFGSVVHLDSRILHEQSISECVEAWRSHATLERQAGSKFGKLISIIEHYLMSLNTESITIPYTTNIWAAQLK
jgi:ubiquinone/menaquinone biosynthesis C-methylase UbiE